MSECCDKDQSCTIPSPPQPQEAPPSTANVRYRIEKMDCPTEEKLIRKRLENIPGVARLDFDLLERVLTVHHTLSTTDGLVAALNDIGMGPVELGHSDVPSAIPSGMPTREKLALVLSAVTALSAEVLAWNIGRDTAWPVAMLAVFSILAGGLPTLRKGWIALRSFTLNINFLMSLAVLGAIAIRKWPEAAMVTFLFAVAEGIERLSLENARNAIRSLAAIAPDVAEIKSGSIWQQTPVSVVPLGAVIRLRTGERVPLDSRISEGNLSVNEAPITGESMPVEKGVGTPLFAGTIVVDGAAEAIVTALAGQSTLARIANAVQDAQKQRAPTQRFVDVFARYYTPSVFLLALVITVLGSIFGQGGIARWVYEGLVILVIACPCALVISTPVSIVCGLTAAAKRGILIKGGVYLESGHKLKAVAMDKTGTLTRGTPQMTNIIRIGSSSGPDPLHYAASLDDQSTHPIARAVVTRFREKQPSTPLLPVTGFRVIQGRGVAGRIEGTEWHLGNHRLVEELGLCSGALESILRDLEEAGKTALVLIGPVGPIAAFGVADTVRIESASAVQTLRSGGVTAVMLTGDNWTTAKAVAFQVGITEVHGELLPEEKARTVAALHDLHGMVAMVGDGVNDAPALARADIGFAMGAAGTATAMETADVAIMDDDLRKVPEFIRLSRKTAGILKQNITAALLIKFVFLILAVSQRATLWMAILADMGGSLLVVFNGLRLLRRTPRRTNQ
jgi:Cd2+/Zn2+-exporting ATPase